MGEKYEITMRDIQMAIAKTEREDFIRFGIKDYRSLRQIGSRLIARLRGKRVWTYKEYMKELNDLAKIIFP